MDLNPNFLEELNKILASLDRRIEKLEQNQTKIKTALNIMNSNLQKMFQTLQEFYHYYRYRVT